NCSDSDPAEFPSRHQVRNSLPGVCARFLRHLRIEPAGIDARDRRLRLVWNSGMDWRRGIEHLICCNHSAMELSPGRTDWRSYDYRMDFLPAVLGNEHLHHLSRHGLA